MKQRLVSLVVVALILALAVATPLCAQQEFKFATDGSPIADSSLTAINEFDAITEGQRIADFKIKTIYENEYGNAVGAEFRHVPSNFVLDVLRIESIPQGFIWVNTPPPTDGGEPHTLEHLVLGKGIKAQWVASYEDMSLSSSSAGTGQTETGYHFYAGAGKEVFFKVMEVKLDALIHPNYSDEEIRREMCNIGYSVDPTDSSIQLEEKGSVYTEMVSGFEGTWSNMYMKLGEMLYGEDHPLSNESGGYPPAIRERTAEELRKFHDTHYRLNNMGMVLSVGSEIDLEELLTRTSEIFKRLEPDATPGQDPALAGERFPKPQSAPPGTIAIADFPHQNEKEPGVMLYAWPPVLDYDFNEAYLRQCFVANLAGGESSNLYKRFIDSQTRIMDLGASGVFGWTSDDQGCPVYVGFSNVKQDVVNEQTIDSVRSLILAEIRTIAGYADDSEELKEFNQRIANRVIEERRELRTNLNKPPRFGYRGASFWWIGHLHQLYRTDGFRKKLTTNERLNYVENLLASGKNFWKSYIDKWQMLSVKPYGTAARPNTDMIAKEEAARDQRLEAFVGDLMKRYGVSDRKEAIDRYVAEYDAKTAAIDKVAASIETPGFIDNPPLSLDENLKYEMSGFRGGGDMLVAWFDNITSAEVGLYLDMTVVPESLLVYVSALPTLLTEVGIIRDGKPLAYDETREKLRQEVLDVEVEYATNPTTERVELSFVGSGSTLEESVAAVDWIRTFLFDADWRPENLPRMSDAIDVALTSARNGMKGWEEYWVSNPSNAYWKQTNPLLLEAGSFLTQQHSLMRVKWMLKEAGSEDVRKSFEEFMSDLYMFGEKANRQQLTALATYLSTGVVPEGDVELPEDIVTGFESNPATELIKAAANDLLQNLGSIPDGSLNGDWQYLCGRIKADLAVRPEDALGKFKHVMGLLRHTDNVRGYMVSNYQDQQQLGSQVMLTVQGKDGFSAEPSVRQTYADTPVVHARLGERLPEGRQPVYVGLVNPNTRNGVFINTAPCAGFYDSDPDKIMDFLAARLYGGGGAHSMFMKTWAAGLAYSNGLRSNQFSGRLMYYAERCPSLVQTMQFVINELKAADPDPGLADYAVAQAFEAQRAGATYEGRARGMAADLVDGLTPETIAEFRKTILELRKQPDFFEQLKSRMMRVYGQVLPGLDPKSADVEGGNFLMIGPEMQFEEFEQYLQTVEDPNAKLYRIYPRDFWVIASK